MFKLKLKTFFVVFVLEFGVQLIHRCHSERFNLLLVIKIGFCMVLFIYLYLLFVHRVGAFTSIHINHPNDRYSASFSYSFTLALIEIWAFCFGYICLFVNPHMYLYFGAIAFNSGRDKHLIRPLGSGYRHKPSRLCMFWVMASIITSIFRFWM